MSARLRSRRFWVLVLLAASVLSVLALPLLANGGGGGPFGGAGTVVVVRLDGVIQDGGGSSLFSGATLSPAKVDSLLDSARARRPDALVLRVNSPGGSVAASEEILSLINRFRDETGVPVIVSMGDVAASGGYYISVGSDAIVANAGTLTGSIGVVWEVLELTGLYEKLGIEDHVVASGRHKAAFAVGKVDPEAESIIQEMADQMHAQFIQAVADGRGLTVDAVWALATGQPYTGLQAQDLGLVDEIGGLETAIAVALDRAGLEDARVVEVQESVFSIFGASAAARDLLIAIQAKLAGAELAILEGLVDARSGPRYAAW